MTEDIRSYRPALVALQEDMRALTGELLDGLASERRVLTWLQEMTVGTLGRLDWKVYNDMARQFRGQQGVLLAAFVRPAARRGDMRDLGEPQAEDVRERFVGEYIHPALRNAFRTLRNDASEYIDGASEEDAHAPDKQRHRAMRPALTELDQWQERALSSLLAGFESRREVLDWGHDVLLATHGELDQDWVSRVVRERGSMNVLTGDTDADQQARRLFAAHYLLPRYRTGVVTTLGGAGELADAESERKEAQFA